MRARAFAKVNLSLQVRAPDRSGYHPLRSLVRSIDWSDELEVVLADDDAFTVDGPVPADETNLAWRAIEAVRQAASTRRPVRAHLSKDVPHAAGLGGGSADAAAALRLASTLFRFDGELAPLGRALGADVPFCLRGGAAWMEGHGEVLSPAPETDDYALAVVVPPLELPTARVYRRWDDLGGPEGPPVGGRILPVSLRDLGPLRNDLTPAAVSLRPDLGDWIADAARTWGQPALMSGSGSAFFGFFPSVDEAAEAARAIPGTRAARGCAPAARGVTVAREPDEDA